MEVEHGATTSGILSLYNKGLVPKRIGKVAMRSKFASNGRQLYEVVQDDEQFSRTQPAANEDRTKKYFSKSQPRVVEISCAKIYQFTPNCPAQGDQPRPAEANETDR